MMFQYEQALKEFKNTPKKLQKSTFLLNCMGFCSMKLAKYEEAYQYFKAARKSNKLDLYNIDYFSSCLWQLNKPLELIELSETLYKYFPTSSKTWVVMGNSYSALQDHSTSIKFL